jgi:hypothetical protein
MSDGLTVPSAPFPRCLRKLGLSVFKVEIPGPWGGFRDRKMKERSCLPPLTGPSTSRREQGRIHGGCLGRREHRSARHVHEVRAGIRRRHAHAYERCWIVGIKGAYLYKDETGEKRVGPGDFLRIPGPAPERRGQEARCAVLRGKIKQVRSNSGEVRNCPLKPKTRLEWATRR